MQRTYGLGWCRPPSFQLYHVTKPASSNQFPNFEMHDAKIASAKEQDHHEPLLQEEGQPGGAEGRVTGAHEADLDSWDLFCITLRADEIQDFDTRWDQVLLSTSE